MAWCVGNAPGNRKGDAGRERMIGRSWSGINARSMVPGRETGKLRVVAVLLLRPRSDCGPTS